LAWTTAESEFYKMILVTGGCGFIGTNLISALLHSGYTVRVLDDLSCGNPQNLANLTVELIVGNVCNIDTVKEAMVGVDSVIHLAGQTSVQRSIQDPRLDFNVNASGTLNLLLACRNTEIKHMIFASSNAVLGKAEMPVDEMSIPHPISPYGSSKLSAEIYCQSFFEIYGLPITILRFSNVYGPFSSHKESVIARFIKDILTTNILTIYGDGNQTRDFIHVFDLCRAILTTLQTDKAIGQIFQISSGVEISIKQLAILIISELSKQNINIHHLPARKGDIYRNYANIEKAWNYLSWRPDISIQQGIQQTSRWFLERAS
jgi:UDP-glucose 4-epimerase